MTYETTTPKHQRSSWSFFFGVLAPVSILAPVIATANINMATAGVGLLAVACFPANLARIAHADIQHAELMNAIEEGHQGGQDPV